MTIRQAYKKLEADVHGIIRRATFDIVFQNSEGEMDETQFTVLSGTRGADKELAELFKCFCKENGYKENSVINIVLVDDN